MSRALSNGSDMTEVGGNAMESGRPLRVLILSKELSAPGGVVHFVSFLMDHFSSRVEAVHLPIGRRTEGGSAIGNIIFPVVNSIALVRTLLWNKFDCIHINPSLNMSSLLRDGLFMGLLRVLRCRNIIVYFHGWSDVDAERIQRSPMLRLVFKALFGRACVIMVLAARFKKSLVKIGIPAERVQVTSTMFDGNSFRGLRARKQGQRKELVFMSRFVCEKGVYELLDAFARIARKYPDAHLTLLGDGPEKAEMEQRVATLNLTERVSFPGYMRGREKIQFLLDADLFVFPTYYGEGCPVVLLEAMAAGLPIVTHGAGGIPDLFTDGEHGVLLERVTPELIEQAIDKLVKNKKLQSEIGERNRQYAWARFEAGVVTKAMELTYQQAVGRC